MFNPRAIAVMIGSLAICGCVSGPKCNAGRGAAPAIYGPAGRAVCRSSADSATIQVGNYRLTNNVWNKVAACGPCSQSVFTEILNGAPAFGWSWRYPDADVKVVSYPELGYGYSPWNASSWGGSPSIPARIGTNAIAASFDVLSSHKGAYDLAFDIWVTDPTNSPTSSDIKYEIMIWLDHSGFPPAGARIARGVAIGGRKFDVWEMAGMKDGKKAKWTDITYVAEAPVYRGSVDISEFFADLVAKRGVPNSLFIASIEFGNEVMAGSGVTEIVDWSVAVE